MLYRRYHLGGPLSLRGFAPYGIGPRAPATSQNEDKNSEKPNADSLGGIGKSSFLATLSVPLNLKVNLKTILMVKKKISLFLQRNTWFLLYLNFTSVM
jgi:outer membrane protein assembly factor BamA